MKKIRQYLTKKQYIIFTLSLIVIILSSFSYAFYLSVENTDDQLVTSECFKLSFEDENDIDLDESYPMSDSEGSSLTPYTFTIKNVCKKAGDYQVNIEITNDTTLNTNYLKYKLDNRASHILGNELGVQEYINENIKESRNIEAGVILPNEEITYNLRMWIEEEATPEQSANKLFKSKVVVKTIDNKEPYQEIILNANGGEITHNEIIRVKTRKFQDIEEPTRVGYFFEDWFSDSEYTNRVTSDTIVTDQITNLYAKWIAREDTAYRVEHYQMDTSGNYPSTPNTVENLTGTTDTSVTPAVKTYTGFKSPSTQTVNIDGDGSRVVKYYYSRNKYTITYNANSGSVSPASVTDYYGKNVTLPTPTRTGYTFNGWYTAASGGTKYGNAGASYTISSSLTMVAQWTRRVEYAEVDKLKSAASGKGNGVYYYDTSGNLDYGNGTKINLSNPNSSIRGNVSIWNNKVIWACINYSGHYYEFKGVNDTITERSFTCATARKSNLVYNGTLSLANNTNFPNFTYNSGGYLYTTANNSAVAMTDFIPVDKAKTYTLSLGIKSSTASSKYLIGLYEYDADFKSTESRMYLNYSNTQTTLKNALKQGDTVVYFTSLANWSVTSDDSTPNYRQRIMFWDYKDYTGYTYGAQTYTRHYTPDDSYVDSKVNKSNNTITLKSAYTGATVPAGTKVSQGNAGSTYNYALASGSTLTTSWQTLTATLTGESNSGLTAFRYGTKYVRLFIWPGYNSNLSSVTTYIRNISFKES